MLEDMTYEEKLIFRAVEGLIDVCHGAAVDAGWWNDPRNGESILANPLCFSNKVALMHSELSEALEADRKDLMDDKLPHRPGMAVELADLIIRAFDTAGGFGMDLGEIVIEKLRYNAQRADHKIENRIQDGGKAY